jgi:3'-phosphoadenosine 5'-phosphosulfate (PAPS) 3'-phosphatase
VPDAAEVDAGGPAVCHIGTATGNGPGHGAEPRCYAPAMHRIDLETLDLAADIMHDATNLAIAARRGLPPDAIVQKPDGSVVTAVDVALQIYILSELERAFGRIPVIAEEDHHSIGGKSAAEAHCRALLHEWGFDDGESEIARLLSVGQFDGRARDVEDVWVLDPIDGTQGFVDHQHWCPCLALLRKGEPVFASNGYPTLAGGVLLSAVAGEGCWSYPLDAGDEGEPARWSVASAPLGAGAAVRVVAPSRATDAQKDARRLVGEASGHPCTLVHADSQAKYGLVILGEADIAYSRRGGGPGNYIWDHAGAVLLAREAGAWVGDVDEGPIECGLGRRLVANSAVICAARGLGPTVARVLAERDRSENLPLPRRERA